MKPSRSSYDVVVVGAGPAGTVSALAHARRGASVLLLEADPRAAKRFAGEWLHPTGVGVLDELRVGRLERARARAGYGFVIFPDDGSEPIEMPYASGVALSAEHGELVLAMREAASQHAGVELVTEARAVRVGEGVVRVEDRRTGAAFDVRAGRVVGADGKRSTVRAGLGLEEKSTPLSYMASVELRDVELPREGFGHLVLGGPGPALFYRIGDGVVRGCLDVPVALGPDARSPERLWDGFAPVMPPGLRTALRAALERGPNGWAINRFRPRSSYGARRGGADVALVGDAVGHVHPMTAIGMTLGLLDAKALAEASDPIAYGKAQARRSYIPELLSNALYHCFRREDESATAVRRAMFRTLRADAAERRRTMDILACADPRRRSFGSAFLRIAAQAVGQTVSETTERGGLARLPRALAGFGEWMQWPAALVLPSAMDDKVRARSSSTHPIPQLSRLLPSAAPMEPPPREPGAKPAAEVALTDAIEAGSSHLLRELEALAMRFGSEPDAALAGPALSCMRAIVSTEMRIGMAARMTLGRRRLAVEGFPRLLTSPTPRIRHLAELTLVLLDGARWDELPVASLAEGVRALLDGQAPNGGFGPDASAAARGVSDLEHTGLACRALDVVARRRPDATDADLDRVMARAAAWMRGLQRDDGSWSAEPTQTAWALEALIAARVHPGDPAVRRGVRWLVEDLRDHGTQRSEATLAVHARAVRALVAAGGTDGAIVATARQLAGALVDAEARDWVAVREIVEALAACEARRVARPRRVRRARRPAPTADAFPVGDALREDWAFCKDSLAKVSRTFARPIAMLPPELEVAVSLGYLLCRIADTIEDHVAVEPSMRDELFGLFLSMLEDDGEPRDLAAAFLAVDGDDAELELARSSTRVMRVFAAQREPVRSACVRWVTEMARGMSLYAHRAPGPDGVAALHTVPDLERYCYYVAGTVGHLLTDLFVDAIGEDPEGALALALRDHAEGFATGLQLTNILKDVTDDLERGVSFLPRSECIRHGFAPASLREPAVRARAHAAVAPIFDVARRRLDEALEYSLAIPAEHPQIRLFCLLPLWMAARTLVLARGNDAMFEPEVPVKISRPEVEALIAECVRLAGDDDALRARYTRLYEPGTLDSVAGAG
ncbi:MAG TPA: squalene/phytoene synthase family protein [Sandaracinaceae bacterium LLY-WYZ-13_1]|nr:squalene/phytoene synthase family protein [Sandaracinaceae bacterium LLY-WYZ-13_1]